MLGHESIRTSGERGVVSSVRLVVITDEWEMSRIAKVSREHTVADEMIQFPLF